MAEVWTLRPQKHALLRMRLMMKGRPNVRFLPSSSASVYIFYSLPLFLLLSFSSLQTSSVYIDIN